jgi:hypothetical protein
MCHEQEGGGPGAGWGREEERVGRKKEKGRRKKIDGAHKGVKWSFHLSV